VKRSNRQIKKSDVKNRRNPGKCCLDILSEETFLFLLLLSEHCRRDVTLCYNIAFSIFRTYTRNHYFSTGCVLHVEMIKLMVSFKH